MERAQKKKGGGGGGPSSESDIKDLSNEIPAVQDILDKIGSAIKRKVEPPKPGDGGCCLDLMRDVERNGS